MDKQTQKTFWEKVKVGSPDECWPWQYYRDKRGYGRLSIKDVVYLAHRVAYSLSAVGDISLARCRDIRLDITLHTCDNPPCCNPAHLIRTTQKSNVADAFAKKRMAPRGGTNSIWAKLTEEQVKFIRENHSPYDKEFGTKALAETFGVTEYTMYCSITGRSYAA